MVRPRKLGQDVQGHAQARCTERYSSSSLRQEPGDTRCMVGDGVDMKSFRSSTKEFRWYPEGAGGDTEEFEAGQ